MATSPVSSAAPEPYMKAPKRVTIGQLEKLIGEWLMTNADQRSGNQFFHKKCGGRISDYFAFMSVHDFGGGRCSGGGDVEQHALPRCIECQPISPYEGGCLHPEEDESAIEKLGGKIDKPWISQGKQPSTFFSNDWKEAMVGVFTMIGIFFSLYLAIVAAFLIWRHFFPETW